MSFSLPSQPVGGQLGCRGWGQDWPGDVNSRGCLEARDWVRSASECRGDREGVWDRWEERGGEPREGAVTGELGKWSKSNKQVCWNGNIFFFF